MYCTLLLFIYLLPFPYLYVFNWARHDIPTARGKGRFASLRPTKCRPLAAPSIQVTTLNPVCHLHCCAEVQDVQQGTKQEAKQLRGTNLAPYATPDGPLRYGDLYAGRPGARPGSTKLYRRAAPGEDADVHIGGGLGDGRGRASRGSGGDAVGGFVQITKSCRFCQRQHITAGCRCECSGHQGDEGGAAGDGSGRTPCAKRAGNPDSKPCVNSFCRGWVVPRTALALVRSCALCMWERVYERFFLEG